MTTLVIVPIPKSRECTTINQTNQDAIVEWICLAVFLLYHKLNTEMGSKLKPVKKTTVSIKDLLLYRFNNPEMLIRETLPSVFRRHYLEVVKTIGTKSLFQPLYR